MKKVALVTGASSGIGYDTAIRLVKAGYMVYGAARRTDLLGKLAAWGAKGISLDITNQESIKNCVEEIIKAEGRIDLLVNNAGYGLGGSIEDVPLEEAKNQFEVNVFGLAQISRLVLPYMRKQGEGRIINISSMAGRFSSPFLGWYHASKYCVEALSDALRLEVMDFGVKVILIEPGLIQTNWGKIAADNIKKYSGESDYSKNASSAAKFYEENYNPQNKKASDPSIISKTVVKAATAKNPKVRYLIGTYAKPFVFFKNLFSDKFYDKVMKKVLCK